MQFAGLEGRREVLDRHERQYGIAHVADRREMLDRDFEIYRQQEQRYQLDLLRSHPDMKREVILESEGEEMSVSKVNTSDE